MLLKVNDGTEMNRSRSPSRGASISTNSLSQPFPEYIYFKNGFFPRKVSYFCRVNREKRKKNAAITDFSA